MAEWKNPLPEVKKIGDKGHVDDHNLIVDAIKEVRTIIDGLSTQVADAAKTAEWSKVKNPPSIPPKATVDNLEGITAVGKALLKAADEAKGRDAIKAGTGSSDLALGTTATTALKGDTKIPADQAQTVTDLAGRVKALEDAATPPAEG